MKRVKTMANLWMVMLFVVLVVMAFLSFSMFTLLQKQKHYSFFPIKHKFPTMFYSQLWASRWFRRSLFSKLCWAWSWTWKTVISRTEMFGCCDYVMNFDECFSSRCSSTNSNTIIWIVLRIRNLFNKLWMVGTHKTTETLWTCNGWMTWNGEMGNKKNCHVKHLTKSLMWKRLYLKSRWKLIYAPRKCNTTQMQMPKRLPFYGSPYRLCVFLHGNDLRVPYVHRPLRAHSRGLCDDHI